MTGALLSLLLASCADVSQASAALEQTKSEGDLLVAMKTEEQELGFSLLRGAEQQLPFEKQRMLAASRIRSACALVGQKSAAGVARNPTVTEILDRPEFAGARDRGSDALVQLWRRFTDWIESMLGEKPAQTFADSVRVIVLGLAGALAAVIALRLRRLRFGGRARSTSPATGEALQLLDPSVHFVRAEELRASNPRLALREGLLALLSSLERKRYARPDRVKTNRELAQELPERGAPPAVTAQVSELLHGFDRTFYSLEEVRSETAGSFLESVAKVQRLLEAQR
ncbi:MAG: DUF4129 domain-containing protein [Myxococcaceae bacterium]